MQINTVVCTIDEAGSAAPRQLPLQCRRPTRNSIPPRRPRKRRLPRKLRSRRPSRNPAGDAGPGTDVAMPQMGESITEGTITKWLKNVGDTVQRDEPIFEISTDKVDAEIPSPIAGTLVEIRVKEGADGHGRHDRGGDRRAAVRLQVPAPASAKAAAAAQQNAASAAQASAQASRAVVAAGTKDRDGQQRRSAAGRRYGRGRAHYQDRYSWSSEKPRRVSPADDAGIAAPPGVSRARRSGGTSLAATRPSSQCRHRCRRCNQRRRRPLLRRRHGGVQQLGELVPMSKMRSIIAKRMVESKHTSAHVHTVFKVDMTRIVRLREKGKEQVRAAQRRQADLHALHHAGRGGRAADAPRRQCGDPGRRDSSTTRTSTSGLRSRSIGV